jgi:hypothetical protein
MTGITALDIVIGLIFIYLLFSLLVTILQEMIATNFRFRSKVLEKAIIRMLEDENHFNLRIGTVLSLFGRNNGQKSGLSNKFYEHPLIKFLGEDKNHSKPSYIKNESFSKVIIDLLRGDSAKPGDNIASLIQDALDKQSTNWGKIPIGAQTLSYLKSIWTDAQGDVDKFRDHLEKWFDETMERASGWYKKYTQIILLFLGLIIAIVFNADTIKIVKNLNKDPKLREQLVQQANDFLQAHPDLRTEYSKIENDSVKGEDYERLKKRRDELLARSDSLITGDISKVKGSLGLGIEKYKWEGWPLLLKSILGWILTALALSLGAPFWFDMLSKIMKVKTSIATSNEADNKSQTGSEIPLNKRKG